MVLLIALYLPRGHLHKPLTLMLPDPLSMALFIGAIAPARILFAEEEQ